MGILGGNVVDLLCFLLASDKVYGGNEMYIQQLTKNFSNISSLVHNFTSISLSLKRHEFYKSVRHSINQACPDINARVD